jgi:O-antigen/teichoic acid export membrane protein
MYSVLRSNSSFIILLQRSWQAIAGVVTLVLVTHFLSPTEQGYFYTLSSIAALYMALDMGLSTVLIQFSAREFIGLSWGNTGTVQGDLQSRFLTLIMLSIRWYGLAAIIFLLIYPVGVYFIGNGNEPFGYDWHIPWAILVVSTAILLLSLPILAIIEGSGRISEIYFLRLIQGFIGSIAIWIVLVNDGGLYAVAVLPLFSAIIAIIWIFIRQRNVLIQSFKVNNSDFSWGSEVWPLQWRVSASWLSGYALVLMHTPLLFNTQGPIEAGKMGVTMTVVSMLSILSLSWLTSRIPDMTKFASTKEWNRLDSVYWNVFRKSCAAYILGAIIFFILRLMLEDSEYGDRFLSITETLWLLVAMGFYHVTGIFVTYLRVHMKEPFLWPAIIGSTLTIISVILVAPQWGALGIVTILVIINALFFLPVVLWMWVRLRKKWHN